ncbi:MAG: hypothetical protein JXA68_09095, partial [Ignavibacteriales bacterium]|nr:hypothetical protein [Ignavibacteriales bacterium]
MMKKLSALFIISVIFSFVAQAQTWNNTGPWPDTSWLNGTQGIAVDPDGKVWYSDYWNQDTLDDGTGTRCIYCFHPDGTPASFSPIKVINVGGPFGTYDTLGTKSTYGVKTELKTGNIIYTNSNSDVFLINYKTGDGLAKANLGIGSLACPASDTNGTIFIIDVTAGSIIKMLSWDGFSTTFTDLGNAIENTPDLSRCLEVSADGNTIYAAYLTASRGVLIYHRADEFSPYLVVDSTTFKGWAVESITMHPITGNLWLSGNSYYYTAVDSLTLQNCGQLLTKNVWYAYDFGSSAIVDSIAWLWYPHPDSLSDQQRSDLYRPRGIDFCPTGDTAYIGTFGSNVEWGIERVIRDTPYLGVE